MKLEFYRITQKTILGLVLGIVSCYTFGGTPTMNWEIDSKGSPITILTFGLTVNATASRDEFYFANQFGFTGGGGIGYIGMQPTAYTSDGEMQFRVLFSSFRKGTVPLYPSCKGGADGSTDGATCRIYVPATLGALYKLDVKKDGNVLTGTVTNTKTGRVDVIGKWSVDNEAGNLSRNQVSWVENYLMNNSSFKLTCDVDGWPYYEVKFSNPVANGGTLAGQISEPDQGSTACPGALVWVHDSTGTLLQGGYR
ncbi:hypothetical protein WN982_28230 [Paraburkholderia sp. IMGN_8]|uniref:hypothetical protein n=1 Tax=Paraburkholderia sp. IMGN_8 TaxID=3136564 RepID=UPI003100E918